jgi:DNA primase
MTTETTKKWRNLLGESERLKLVKKASECLWLPDGKIALDYLVNERGLSEAVIRQFQMGYVPLGVQHQTRGRLIHPIWDASGELVAISTRHLHKPKNESFWHEEFEKSFYLYGLHLAKSAILDRDMALVVEGELDVTFYHSHGIPFTVGLMGHALSLFHISLLARYCSRIFLLFDGDAGGKQGFEKAKELYNANLEGRVEVIPCRMSDGMDPDDFLKQGGKKAVDGLMRKEYEQFRELGYF